MPKNATLFFDIELLKIDGKSVNECNEDNGTIFVMYYVKKKVLEKKHFIRCQIFKNY